MSDDLLQGLRDAGVGVGSDTDIDELMKTLKNLPGFQNMDRETLLQNLAQGGTQPPVGYAVTNPWVEISILLGLISLVMLLIVFIGYRLYDNMVIKEKRRELKKLQKEQKKKK